MRIQLLSDLHLETETFDPQPAPGAEVLVLAGDVDTTWAALARFAHWPVPVLMVAGNHEFDRREVAHAWAGLHARCAQLGIRLLEHDEVVLVDDAGRRVRFVGTVRWCDFDLFGPAQRERALRAGSYFQKVQQSTVNGGQPFDVAAVREAGLADRRWLEAALSVPAVGADGQRRWEAVVAITHFAPSLRSADPRFGPQPGTASFCNADDDLIERVDVWLHGHLHCRHDYRVARPGRAPARVVCNARGLARKGEAEGYDGQRLIVV